MRFPDGRPMTPAEQRGYDLACETLEVWGGMIARAGRDLAHTPRDVPTVPLSCLMEQKGQLVADLARAARMQAACEIVHTGPAGVH